MNDYHKPTFTFPSGAYNATQVRLYGIPLSSALVCPGNDYKTKAGNTTISYSYSDDTEIDENIKKKLSKFSKETDPSRVKLPPVPPALPAGFIYQIPIDIKTLGRAHLTAIIDLKDEKPLSCGLIYGYAYEGHCYDLPKPKIMIVPALPDDIPPNDCGYAEKGDSGYRLWLVDKLNECVELELNQGFVEQLVLEANLPGRRSPSTYRATMALSHRGGRLTD